MKIYIAGKITGDLNYKSKFECAEKELKELGYTVMNPAILPEGFDHHQYMSICIQMLNACNFAYFLKDWQESKGAKIEHEFAKKSGKIIKYEVARV